MKLNYLFVDTHNGHMTTYHPFTSNTVISQERTTNWLNEIPGANRMGTHVGHLLDKLIKNNIDFEVFKCPCCEKVVDEIKHIDERIWEIAGIKWQILHGISGNY